MRLFPDREIHRSFFLTVNNSFVFFRNSVCQLNSVFLARRIRRNTCARSFAQLRHFCRYFASHCSSRLVSQRRIQLPPPARWLRVADALENSGYKVTNGAGRGPEEWIPGPKGGTEGGTFVDVTAKKGGATIRIQTITTLADGKTPTPAEQAAAARIRQAFPKDKLYLIPKQVQQN